MNVINLYNLAEEMEIEVHNLELPITEAMSIMDDDGYCHIGMDTKQVNSYSDEKVKLAHELGHCATGAFYNRYSRFDNRKKHENRATKWAIKQLVPESELHRAVKHGIRELWELSEHFSVTEEFMHQAVYYYKNGHVA